MLAPELTLPTGALGELHRRIGMELGAIPPPEGTERVERTFSLPLRGTSMNKAALKSRSFDSLKIELQGLLMREMHRLHYLLPRPIPSIGHDGKLAPVWAHASLRFEKPANRDDENFRVLISKSWGDGLTGPKLKRVKGKLVDADRTLEFRGRAYEGRWIRDDNRRNWMMTFAIEDKLGPDCLACTLVWDQPVA
jgi:hypothetical protein